MDLFSKSVVFHLPKFHSDHRPILPSTEDNLSGNRTRPFRFLNAWVTDASFANIVKDCWRNNLQVEIALKEFVGKIAMWIKDSFGFIKTKKRKITSCILGVQKALGLSNSQHLIELESTLVAELETILT